MSQINPLQALATGTNDSALAFKWLGVDINLGQNVLRIIEGAQNSLFSTFDFVKSIHRPVDIIPATLHPVDNA